MLSPFFPSWIIPTLSPLFNFIRGAIPETWRGGAMLLVCLLATAGVAAATPLGFGDVASQAIILFGIVTAGYTILKPIETAPAKVGIIAAFGAVAIIGVGLTLGTAWAQETVPGAVQATASFWVQVGMGFLNGVLGRLVKRIHI